MRPGTAGKGLRLLPSGRRGNPPSKSPSQDRAGVFERLWAKLLTRYDDLQGIQSRWQALRTEEVLGIQNVATGAAGRAGEEESQAPTSILPLAIGRVSDPYGPSGMYGR